MTLTFANSPDHQPARLGATQYVFEDLEVYPGLLVWRGHAEIEINRFGEWEIEAVTLEAYGRFPDRTLSASDKNPADAAIFKLVCAALQDQRASRILDDCMAAGE